MGYDPYREAWLDVQAVGVLTWLQRCDGWDSTDPEETMHDPVLRWMAHQARHAPMALAELEHRAYGEFEAEEVSDRIARVRWAMTDTEAYSRAAQRLAAADPKGGLHPFVVTAEDPDLAEQNLRPVVIEGLLRKGETANLIAPPKVGKTWLVHSLALAAAEGGEWLGRRCGPSRVLIVDNELHEETMRFRLAKSCQELGANPCGRLEGISLRGQLRDLHRLCEWLATYPRGQWDIVILDAFYRMVPRGKSENDNAEMAQLYNTLDRTAADCDLAFVLVHHSSKGNQAGKSVTDVGSGAGSMSRAADGHIVLRKHRIDNCVVLEAAARSFPPPEPQVLEWTFPIWITRDDLDPKDLDDGTAKSSRAEWPIERIAAELLGPNPVSAKQLRDTLAEKGCSQHWAREATHALDDLRRLAVQDFGRDTHFYLTPEASP